MPAAPRSLVLPLAAVLAGCSILPGAGAPDGLAYDRPDPDPATYTFSDTAVFAIETAMGDMEVLTARSGVAELDFRRWSDGRVTVRLPRFEGTFRNPTQGAARVDTADIGGPFVVRLGYDGRIAVTDTPSLSQALLDIAGPESLVRPLFVQLPARPVGPGATWVDTVETVEESGGTRSVARSVITSTLVGDTVAAGRTLLRIRTESQNTIEVSGVSGGVEVAQRLSGTTVGRILWDDAAHVLIERVATGELTGTLELPGVAVDPMPIRATLRRTVSLRE